MSKNNNIIKVDLIQKTPHKIYKTEVKSDYHIKEFCKFLRGNKDKNVGVIINNKHIKFNSLAGKKKFASGFECGGELGSNQTKELFKKLRLEIDGLRSEIKKGEDLLKKEKEKYTQVIYKLKKNETLRELRQSAAADQISELNEDREVMKDRLNKIEPIIKLINEAKTKGQLQQALVMVKKLK